MKNVPGKPGQSWTSRFGLRRILQTQYIKPTDGGSQEDCVIIVLCSLMFSIMPQFFGGSRPKQACVTRAVPPSPLPQPTNPRAKVFKCRKAVPPSDLPVLVCRVSLPSKGGGGTPFDRLYGEAPPERDPFLSLRYKKGHRKGSRLVS